MSFQSENEMTKKLRALFLKKLKSEKLSLLAEVEGLLGRPDFLILKKDKAKVSYVVAVEVKLKAWRRALSQAIKYRNFSNESYVVLAYEKIPLAMKNKTIFINSGVGLASLKKTGDFKIHIISKPLLPFSIPLSKRLAVRYTKASNNQIPLHIFQRSTAGRQNFASFEEYVEDELAELV